jgi:hypothetical protein
MKKTALVMALAILMLLSAAFAADVGSLAWNQSNIQTLRSFGKAAIVQFINQWGGSEGTPAAMRGGGVWEFGWYDLAGDGRYELALITGGRCCTDLILFWQSAPGKIRREAFVGATTLADTIRDLNGDGRYELVIWKPVVANDAQAKYYWPAAYRLKDGKYVAASADFPGFYDKEVLPKLAKEIAKTQADARTAAPPGDNPQAERAAGLVMERDKILRVLGRNPTAGLQQAYQWLNSDDPYLLQDAAVTFKDVGGHPEQLKEADASSRLTYCEHHPDIAMRRDLSQGKHSEPAPTGGSVYSSGGTSAPSTLAHHEVPPGRDPVPIHPDTPQ